MPKYIIVGPIGFYSFYMGFWVQTGSLVPSKPKMMPPRALNPKSQNPPKIWTQNTFAANDNVEVVGRRRRPPENGGIEP